MLIPIYLNFKESGSFDDNFITWLSFHVTKMILDFQWQLRMNFKYTMTTALFVGRAWNRPGNFPADICFTSKYLLVTHICVQVSTSSLWSYLLCMRWRFYLIIVIIITWLFLSNIFSYLYFQSKIKVFQ